MEYLFATSWLWGIAIVRVVLGVIFFAHGAQKVLGWYGGRGLKATTGYFTSLGMPLLIAYLVCFFEFLGGIGLIFGLLTRLSALGIIIVMIGAIAKVHGVNGLFLNWQLAPGKGHGYEANLAFIAMGLACLIHGGGSLSIDGLLIP